MEQIFARMGESLQRRGLGKMEEKTSEAGWKWQKYNGLIVHDLRRSAVRNLRLTAFRKRCNEDKRAQNARRFRPLQHRDYRGRVRRDARGRTWNWCKVSAKSVAPTT